MWEMKDEGQEGGGGGVLLVSVCECVCGEKYAYCLRTSNILSSSSIWDWTHTRRDGICKE
jgi:hypothetical protein